MALNHVSARPRRDRELPGERPADWRKFREGQARSPLMDAPALAALRPPLAAVESALEGRRLSAAEALALADARGAEHPALWSAAALVRDRGRPPRVTYSRKVHPAHQPLPGTSARTAPSRTRPTPCAPTP